MASHLQSVEKALYAFLCFTQSDSSPATYIIQIYPCTIWRSVKVKKSWQGQVLICETLEMYLGEWLLNIYVRLDTTAEEPQDLYLQF